MMRTRDWYRSFVVSGGCTVFFLSLLLQAAEPDRVQDVTRLMEAASQRQRESVALMRSSIEVQRQAVQRYANPKWNTLLPLRTLPVASGSPPPLRPGCDPLPLRELESFVQAAAQRQGLQPDLLRSVIRQESGFRPCALSPKGASGLMQLMPATIAQYGVSNPFNPRENIDAGARYLKELLSRYGGDLVRALGAYNAGPSRIDEAGGIPDFPETTNYIKQILLSLPLNGIGVHSTESTIRPIRRE